MATPQKTAQGNWRVQIDVKGHRESGTYDTKREAVEWATSRSTELRILSAGKGGSIKTLRDAIKRYAEEISPTKRGGDQEVKRLNAFQGKSHSSLKLLKKLNDLTAADFGEWRDARLKVVSAGSVLREMKLMASLLETVKREWGWMGANPMRDVKKPPNPDHRDVVISGQQIRALLRAMGYKKGKVRSASHAVAIAFLLALSTGMRAGEICGITWADVHDDYCSVTGKTGARDVPLTLVSRKIISRLEGWSTETIVGINTKSLDALFRKAKKRAGVDGITYHDTRHTAATRLAQKLHVLDLCKMFGWSNTTRALTYFNPTASQIAKRIAR